MQVRSQFDVLIPAWEAERYVQFAHQERGKWKRRMAGAYNDGDHRRFHRLVRSFLNNTHVKTAALSKAGVRRPNTDEWKAEAKLFSPFNPSQETVYWWREPKSSNGWRTVCSLPHHLKATHYLVADVIEAGTILPDFIFNLPGRGREDLTANLLDKLQRGFCAYRVYDIRDCFPSIHPEALRQLNLPRRIIEHALMFDRLKLQRVAMLADETHHGSADQASVDINYTGIGPSGLMQGSPASNTILAHLLKDLPRPEDDGGFLYLYADDLIVVARDAGVCDRVEQNLLEYLEQPQLGPLSLRTKFSGTRGRFEYLGYQFRFDEVSEGWSVSLSDGNWERYMRRRYDEVMKLKKMNPHGIYLDEMKSIRNCIVGFPSISNPDEIHYTLSPIRPNDIPAG